MEFYTSYSRYGDKILYRGYKNGHRVRDKIPFKPTLYIESKEDTGWKSLHGANVSPVQFDSMKEAGEFVKTYTGVNDFHIHGNTNYPAQYIYERYPNELEFDISQINIATLDIEVESNDGFPFPALAEKQVTSIAIWNNQEKRYKVWGFDEYDEATSIRAGYVDYFQMDDEAALLKSFIEWWAEPTNCPDVVTGWNSKLFDMVYLVNRISKTIGEKYAKLLSPWGKINYRPLNINNKEIDCYDVVGIQQLDYLDLFKKFGYKYGAQESYKLDFIAEVILGENKLSFEEHGHLFTLLTSKSRDIKISPTKKISDMETFEKWCHLRDKVREAMESEVDLNDLVEQLELDVEVGTDLENLFARVEARADRECYKVAIDYNIKDVELVARMEDKIGLISLAITMAYKAGVNFDQTFGTTSIWDTFIYRTLAKSKVVIPQNDKSFKTDLGGGHVKDPQTGRHEWVVSFDLASLYPMLICQYNMSPETIMDEVQGGVSPDSVLYDGVVNECPQYSMAATGQYFSKEEKGFIPKIITGLFNERKGIKGQMLKAEQDIDNIKEEMKRRGLS